MADLAAEMSACGCHDPRIFGHTECPIGRAAMDEKYARIDQRVRERVAQQAQQQETQANIQRAIAAGQAMKLWAAPCASV